MQYLCDRMSSFHSKYPLIHYDMYSDDTNGIEEKIENGLLDFAVLSENININKYSYIRLPQQETWGILIRENSPLASKEYIEVSDLEALSIIVPKTMKQTPDMMNWFQETLENCEIVSTYNLLYNAAMMVLSGLGAALCIQLKSSYEGLRFIPISPVLSTRSVLVWKRNEMLSPAVSAFIDYLKKCQKSIEGNEI